MTHDHKGHGPIDMVAIEIEARRMRAEMLSNAGTRFRAWVSGLFAGRPVGQAEPQH